MGGLCLSGYFVRWLSAGSLVIQILAVWKVVWDLFKHTPCSWSRNDLKVRCITSHSVSNVNLCLCFTCWLLWERLKQRERTSCGLEELSSLSYPPEGNFTGKTDKSITYIQIKKHTYPLKKKIKIVKLCVTVPPAESHLTPFFSKVMCILMKQCWSSLRYRELPWLFLM